MTLICPYTENCSIYKNWTEKTNDTRIDIIRDQILSRTYCLALEALKYPVSEGGISANADLVDKLGLKDIKSQVPEEVECSHITLLNILNKL